MTFLDKTMRWYAAAPLVALSLALAGCNASDNAQTSVAADSTEPAQADSGKAASGHTGEADHDEGLPDQVVLSEGQREQLSIVNGQADAGSASAQISAPASVVFDNDRMARIGPRLEAKVLKVTADLGQTVKAGERVAVLDSVALGQAKARYLTTAAAYGNALAIYQRNKKLSDDKIISDAALQESRAALQQASAQRQAAKAELVLYGMDDRAIATISQNNGTPLSRYVLTSPINGVVQRRDLVPGDTITANQTPLEVVDSQQMWVMIDAAESDVARIKTGQSVILAVRSYPDRRFEGKVDWVSQALDEQTRTVRVRAIVPNEQGLLRSGMFGTATIQTDSDQRVALVPIDAVQQVDGKSLVFMPGQSPGVYRPVFVETGDENTQQIEILEGLAPGDSLVVKGAFDLMSALTASERSADH